MKKILSFVILFALVFAFTGCDSNTLDNVSSYAVSSYAIDYSGATSFESALNDGIKVKGKVVQFNIKEYVPDSILGVNCHAGEHLNFIFESELDVETGDAIIVHITEEPSKIFLIGSWKVPCKFIEVIAENDINKETTLESYKEPTTSSIPYTTDSILETNATSSTEPAHSHSYGNATCTVPAKCSCGATRGSALGHAYSNGKCSRCGSSNPNYNPVSISKQNALKTAKSYLKYSAFSKQRLIEQLEYEKFSHEDAVYGVANCGANWNEQALKTAKSYLKYSSFSKQGLIEQLEYEKFTLEQAKFGVANCGANWNEQAAKTAESYLKYSAFSRQRLIEQLEYEGFTHEQAVYGVNSVGL